MLSKIKKFMKYEEYYSKKHEKTIQEYGDRIKSFVKEYLISEFLNAKSSVWVNCQEGIDNIKPVLITVFVEGSFSIKPCTCIAPYDRDNCMSCNMDYQFKYRNRLQEAINDEFGKITGEKFVVVNVFTDCK